MEVIFVLCFLIRIWCNYFDYSIILEWTFLRVGTINIELLLVLDWISFLFIRVIILISGLIYLYSIGYIESDYSINRFIILVFLFILSIIAMIISPSILRILFGWDGLGLVSYCLVIYYNNYSSYNSGMVTILSNRIGDVGLLISIGIMSMNGRWSIYLLDDRVILILLILLAAITKRAQLPFSSWLPLAMAAPTPVSALVHSSTLVTAGVYLLIRFHRILMTREVNVYLLYISIITIFIAGLIANFEFDLKKIIALSTLRQLGLIIIALGLNLKILSFYHLLTHAIFKSLLFICAGIIIHLINNSQDIRIYGSLNEFIPFTIIRFYIANLSLCGAPFLSGFYSKDFIMEVIYEKGVNYLVFYLALISLGITVLYSFRLFFYLFFTEIKFNRYVLVGENKIINLSIALLIVLSVRRGRLMSWLFFYDIYIPCLGDYYKMLTFIVCLLFLIIAYIIFIEKFVFSEFYYWYYFLRRIWFLIFFINLISKSVLILRKEFEILDKTWVEYSRRIMTIMFILKNLKFINNNYKVHIFLGIIVFMRVWFWLILYYLNSLRKILKLYIEDIMIVIILLNSNSNIEYIVGIILVFIIHSTYWCIFLYWKYNVLY